ncbi:MAG: Fe-S cluster assembly protein SufD [Acidobacteria bacterium]|nr:Fe-S cluster assembly protein SufD [Acidobacteriota bacterium]
MARVASRSEQYVTEFERFARTQGGSTPSWLGVLRQGAIESFGNTGFPTTRDEEWRFTSVAPITETTFARAQNGFDRAAAALSRHDIAYVGLDRVSAAELVFVNGRLAPSLSRTEGLTGSVLVRDLQSMLSSRPGALEPFLSRAIEYQDQAFAALNTAFLADGAVVWMPANAVLETPIHLVFISSPEASPTVSHPRVLIVAEENSQARVVETYAGPRGQVYFTNGVTDIFVGPAAMLDHYKIQQESAASFHVARIQARLRRGSQFTSHSLSFGGALVRNDVAAVMEDEGADCTLNGLYLADGHRLVDNHTTIDHARAHCTSHEIYKGILADRARAVFNGKIVVRADAQKTDAKQTNKALLLSDDALINSKPQLEIFANDVKCTHGAAVGQLDDDAIFYLRARGIALDEARAMLIHAFASDILNRVRIDPLRAQLEEELTEGLRLKA